MKAGQHFERACSTPSFLDEKSCMSDTSCMKCGKDPAVICCLDCHLHTRLCGLCDQSVHNFHPFHDCDAVKSGFPSPIPPTVSTDSDGEWIFVGVAAAIFKQLGTKQMYSSYFQRWFCTGTFSRRKVQGLQRGLLKGRIATINCKTFGTAFKEWKFCQYKLDEICLMDWMKCPPCEESQHSVHVDGNMKLYCFKSAGMLSGVADGSLCFSNHWWEELLTEHALQWDRKKIEKLPLSRLSNILRQRFSFSMPKRNYLSIWKNSTFQLMY